jgi:chemotaxis protein CheD
MPTIHRPTDVFLQPGECFVGTHPVRVRTMLGSCVTITLWHPLRRAGAMSHFLLAQRVLRRPDEPLDARYGNESLMLMLDGLVALGVPPAECEAKIVGGGDMFRFHPQDPSGTIGRRNGEAARRMLAAHGIAVQREHLFGEGHRQVVFDLTDGAVYVRQVPRPLALAELQPGPRQRGAWTVTTTKMPGTLPGHRTPRCDAGSIDPWCAPGTSRQACRTKAFPS